MRTPTKRMTVSVTAKVGALRSRITSVVFEQLVGCVTVLWRREGRGFEEIVRLRGCDRRFDLGLQDAPRSTIYRDQTNRRKGEVNMMGSRTRTEKGGHRSDSQ